jgi:pyruvate/2-oxoglutarate dehydrogenase complex dihydrolipoamide dehydrogenase (E3) component
MVTEQCQNLIIGSGVAGKVLSWKIGKTGKTIVIERSMIGGACPNVACLPSKNFVYSAKTAFLANPKTGLGVLSGEIHVNMPAVIRRKRQMVQDLVNIHLHEFQASGTELVMGEGRFVEPKTVEVALNTGGTRRIRGERVFLDVGTRAMIPEVLAPAAPMTHVEILNLERVPEHLVIVGGGFVGLEFAQAMRRFGSRVTIVQHGNQLLPGEDADVFEDLLQLMTDEGIKVLLKADIRSITGRSGSGVQLQIRVDNSDWLISASDILVAAGRTPNTDRLDAEKGDVRLDPNGYVQVNEHLQTSAPDVWAMGECAGSPKFTHVGHDDCMIVLDNLAGGHRSTRDRLIPYCLFTDPELAHIGLTESQAKTNGIAYRLAKMPWAHVLRSHTLSATRGFCKALVGQDDRILGFTAFGAEASEMMAAVQIAMIGKLPYTVFQNAILAHPTTAEGLGALFSTI